MGLNTPEIALIGGGTGCFTLLRELKEFTPNLTAIVNMSDDGGSTGILRDEFGVLPPGDIRQCLVALSPDPEVRDLFSYRFSGGSFENHSLGNIILTGVELQHGSIEKAIEVASSILNITGRVIPVTTQEHTLVMRVGAEIVRGEINISEHEIHNSNARIEHDPPATLNPKAAKSLENADLVVVAPGNLYGSILPTLAVDGMSNALSNSKAKKVVITNLLTKPGQTDGWHVVDYVKKMESYIGQGQIDHVLFNALGPSKEHLDKYATFNELPVDSSSERMSEIKAKTIGAALLANAVYVQDDNDKLLRRNSIRHDAMQVGRQLMRVYYD